MKALRLRCDPERADPRKLARAAARLAGGGVAVVPTDTNYALACPLGDSAGVERIRRLRGLERGHLLTFLCGGFEQLGKYAVVDNVHFRMIKQLVPGPYVFVLGATRMVPRAFSAPKRRTIGFRLPDQSALRELVRALGSPLMSCTLHLPAGSGQPATDLDGHGSWLDRAADIVLDCGELPGGDATVADLSDDGIAILREGRGMERLAEYGG